ncbi:MAG: hypothetical protein HY329_28005 [Chloroflexi bacterium]|nr:hypothetical protein [Chloroflexota bacterium]
MTKNQGRNPLPRRSDPPAQDRPLLPSALGARLFVGVGLLALLALTVFTFWPGSAEAPAGNAATGPAGGGQLVATASTVDLGRVPFDREVEARYELVNTGDQPIRLVGKPEVKTLAGC